MDDEHRCAGALQGVSALAGEGPIGDLDGCFRFIDWLAEAGMTTWQILPLCPPDEFGSPYSSWSTLSGDPALIGLHWLRTIGLLASDQTLPATISCDYEQVKTEKLPLVLQAATRLLAEGEHRLATALSDFLSTASWALDAARFHVARRVYDQLPWWAWPAEFRDRAPAALHSFDQIHNHEIKVWQTALFLFERQWAAVADHARARDVHLIGDMPIYVGLDSVDVWSHQSLFQLDRDFRPRAVAGVPPDAYSKTGQLWGNPLFDWDALAQTGYAWWIERIARSLVHCQTIRLDHFIGFSRYWAVPADAPDAQGGQWVQGPGHCFFDALCKAFGDLPVIAEDLGQVDAGTVALRDAYKIPGMRVLQFGLDNVPGNIHHPSAYPQRVLAYSGTHDTTTAVGFWQQLSSQERLELALGDTGEAAAVSMVDQVLGSAACWAIIPLQDLLVLGAESRLNTPGVQAGNWVWRHDADALTLELARDLRKRIRQAGRLLPQAHGASGNG